MNGNRTFCVFGMTRVAVSLYIIAVHAVYAGLLHESTKVESTIAIFPEEEVFPQQLTILSSVDQLQLELEAARRKVREIEELLSAAEQSRAASIESATPHINTEVEWWGDAVTLMPVHADVALEEADDVAAKMGGCAFAPLSDQESSNESWLLQALGDPDLECVSENETNSKTDVSVAALFTAPHKISVDVVRLDNVGGTKKIVHWTIQKGQSFAEAAQEYCETHEPHRDRDWEEQVTLHYRGRATTRVQDVSIIFRNEATRPRAVSEIG